MRAPARHQERAIASPTADTYTAASGATVRGGRAAPVAPPAGFTGVTIVSTDANVPFTSANQSLVLTLHGSGTAQSTVGINCQAACSPDLSYATTDVFNFSLVRGGVDSSGARLFMVNPWDRQLPPYSSGFLRESHWTGWTDTSPDVPANANTGRLCLYTEARLDAMLDWIEANQLANVSATKRYLTGGSMGAWGSMTYGMRRASRFAAIYPSRPRWRWCETAGQVAVNSWAAATVRYNAGATPLLWDRAGGGTAQSHHDLIAYAANTANTMPWIGWCVGRQDGYMPFQDHIDAVAALRAAGRGFAFVWNDGNHGSGEILSQITASYPYGMFELGKGYPVFSEHSLDGDPAVDLVGGINAGLSFRNVVETTGAWSCQVTHISAACTVKVKPKSSIYTGNPAAQLVTIPGANTWVTVSF